MKRGRKQDDTLPPSRSREIQRAFRQRRSDYIKGLEARVHELEIEVDEVLARHNELLRYTTPEVVAARSASRKKQRNKSKHSLSQFLDVNQPVEVYAHSPSDPLAPLPENSMVPPSSVGSNQSMGSDISPATPAQYIFTDMNGDPPSAQNFSKGPFAPFSFAGQVEHQHQYVCRDNDSSSILARRNQRLLHLWDGVPKANDLSGVSAESPGPPSSQFSHPISASEYRCSTSQIEMLMGIEPVGQSPVVSSQLMSSFDLHHEVRVPPPSSCSLPSLVADSSVQPDQLSVIGFNTYTSNSDPDASPYAFRSPHSQISDRMNPCYTFMDSSNSSSPNASVYRHESPLDVFHPRPLSSQHNQPNGTLSDLISLATTKLDHFEPPKECSYPTSNLQPSPPLAESPVSPDSLENSELSNDDRSSISPGENPTFA
ncbi:hypothetical protein PGT21_017765 [Puccinia graminis f. sp. tritici]|uniref:BZIP domain-containing protein n=2 Tax=Puccinia graminis f. sp. tritici TaxID=56615 RepID=E3K1A8_PUCGT|nr:uncharacterized protein PGTG_04039 [Puccinia graminis f. sp. tritici CRL 75-36-700-3]EFP78083.1 hypothetical protein PGTG_04039 [Puccinia graminis f. sp. tritici CRL 75-36-700-3]KAA1112984.1 hypothetical protein PGT21_017765 [Puccinia graminis f. sp. tritici]